MARPQQHGQISVEQETAYADYSRDTSHAAFNGKKVPATLIFYTSESGFV